jgi:two-component system copper resistance phosphate regulon response regulator CusR
VNILLVEDDYKISSLIKKGLEEYNFQVDIAYDGYTGKRLAYNKEYDIIVLDIILPQINGIDLCIQLRREGINTPVIFLTALSSIEDKIDCFNVGADDYLVKPFELRELAIRINALNKRAIKNIYDANVVMKVSDLELNNSYKTVKRQNTLVELTSKEYNLLEYLLRNKNRVVSRNEIAENVWKVPLDKSNNVIDVYINFLRNKLENNDKPRLIHTIVGIGYIIREP